MRELYEQELRVAQTRGVVSPEEAEALLSEGLRAGRHPLELLMENGVISEETLAEIQAAVRNAAPPRVEGPLTHGSPTRTLQPPSPAAQPPPRMDDPLTPGSPTRTIQPPSPAAAAPPRVDEPLTPGSPTLTFQPAPSQPVPSPQEPAFPVPGWERYQPVRFLGQGGMGRVYLAYDPLLRRNVALKFVRGDDPELMRRFVAEAQAQARVEHERVCKVYEVGEVRGQPFIAMQYVTGRTLLEVARELSLEQMVTVVQQATEGVHAAHRAGLIHRDIKPTNILVERGEDGQWKPYVMDFGLARDWQRETTVTGTVLGTPHYMAPEQARGEVSQLDRRADVYSLGATLYVLLTGKAPIPGSNALEVLSNLATLEPRPLRQLNKNVPVDLEAIVLKCLEREPSARYDSARALAEDLGRFLNGEPVQARTVGVWYRLRKRARKHWALVSMASAALVLVSLALGDSALTRRDVDLRERLARRFAELAADVGTRTRFTALSRLHDTSAERQALRASLREIEQEMQRGGERALGPGHYALGQGWLELGEPAKARKYLELAWQYGFQEPPVASALALALGQLYSEQLLSLGQLPPDQRQARRDELARLYRDPALSWLRRGQSAPRIPPEYLEALLAFYEERYDEALALLDKLGERLPWFYEAPKLRGDILQVRAIVHWGEKPRTRQLQAEAQSDLEAARKAYARAADTAQSLPEVHYGLARVEWAMLYMEIYTGGVVEPYIERALEHLSRALTVDPEHAASWVQRAILYRRLSEFRGKQGGEAEEPLRMAIEAAQKALALEPSHRKARKELGLALWQLAHYRQSKGMDPREQLRQALGHFESVEPDDKDFVYYNALGLVFSRWANYEQEAGADSLSHRGKAIEAFRKATQLDERSPMAWINLAYEYFSRANHPHALTVEEDLEQARLMLEKGRELDPRSVHVATYAGRIQLLRARRLRDTGADERPALAEALSSFREGLAIDPRQGPLHNHVGLVLMEQARGTRDRDENPLPLLDQAQQSFEQALTLDPRSIYAYYNLADVNAERAVYLHSRGRDPQPSALAAQQAAQGAWRLAPGNSISLINLGHAAQLLAAFALDDQGDPRPHLSEAQERLRQALERAPGHVDALLYLAETQAVQARWHARQGRGVDKDFEEAAQAYQQALKPSERLLDTRLAFARFCRERALWRQQAGLDPHAPLKQGLELVEAVLAARPTWAEAQALRVSLQNLQHSRAEGGHQVR
jgi:tetratricopeptide (TPR) repeat protein/predicted Ser/Thr protein kinase